MLRGNPPPPPNIPFFFFFFLSLFLHFSKKNLKISGGGLNPPLKYALGRRAGLYKTSIKTDKINNFKKCVHIVRYAHHILHQLNIETISEGTCPCNSPLRWHIYADVCWCKHSP